MKTIKSNCKQRKRPKKPGQHPPDAPRAFRGERKLAHEGRPGGPVRPGRPGRGSAVYSSKVGGGGLTFGAPAFVGGVFVPHFGGGGVHVIRKGQSHDPGEQENRHKKAKGKGLRLGGLRLPQLRELPPFFERRRVTVVSAHSARVQCPRSATIINTKCPKAPTCANFALAPVGKKAETGSNDGGANFPLPK